MSVWGLFGGRSVSPSDHKHPRRIAGATTRLSGCGRLSAAIRARPILPERMPREMDEREFRYGFHLRIPVVAQGPR
jgi:hypothetical protein